MGEPFAFLSFLLLFMAGLSAVGGWLYRNLTISFMNSWLFIVGIGAFGYIALFYNGPYNIPMFILCFTLLLLNLGGYMLNVRAHWKENFGNGIIAIFFGALGSAGLIFLYPGSGPIIIISLTWIPIIIACIPGFWAIIHHKALLGRLLNVGPFQKTNWRVKPGQKVVLLGFIVSGGLLFGIGTYYAWGATITVQAPDDFKTVSSYWGPPSLSLGTLNSRITATDNYTLQVSNATLEVDAPNLIEGGFAYVQNVSIPGNSTNFCNYTAGAESYPNGTVILSIPLPDISQVNITFRYVLNVVALQYLNISRSTLVMNYHGDFINYTNPFHRVATTYLFQLLDYWEIQFYLDINNRIEFPHVFNYLNSIPYGYQTLNWAAGKYAMFRGISFDFEPGSYNVAPGNPGGTAFPFGESIGNTSSFWIDYQKSWYVLNEQNRTLFQEATAAYQELFTYASNMGYKTYITLGRNEIMEKIDHDVDYTRCPVDPISKNPDVLYGQMCYQDNNFATGRYAVYKDSKDQITLLGNQGKTILLGWIAQGTKYYTDDAEGLERYVKDCKIAQAAGMEEIFHAPLYRMQGKWGDAAILRLHQALNDEPKETITINVPHGQIEQNVLQDVVENLNKWAFFLPLFGGAIVKLGITVGQIIQKRKQ
jgi:hypothetical protein